jgi:hypothetical protein
VRSETQGTLSSADKQRTRGLTTRAIQDGRLVRPDKCESCGAGDCRIETHHTDYTKPYEVQWLCSKCHGIAHRGNKKKYPIELSLANIGKRLLTTAQAAVIASVEPGTLAHWRHRKDRRVGPPWVVLDNGRTVRYKEDEVLEWVRQQGVKAVVGGAE